jgi:hypothetical protein
MSTLKEQKPEWFDANGTLLPKVERDRADSRKRSVEQRVALEVASRADKPKSESQRLLNAQDARIQELQAKLRYALPSEKPGIQTRISVLKEARDTLKSEMGEQSRLDSFAKNKSVSLARENAEALARSWRATYPHASEEAVLLCVEIARSDAWDTPEALADAYWHALEELSAESSRVESNNATLATEAKLLAERDEAMAQKVALESQQRHAEIKGKISG